MQENKTSFVPPQRCALPLPPKPTARAGWVSFLSYLRLFRSDILSAQPGHPYRAWMTFVPLVVPALWKGGWWIALIPIYGRALMLALDLLLGRNLRNPDPATPDEDLFWFRLPTSIWLPVQLCLVYGAIWCLTHLGDYSALETLGIMFGIGVTTGTVGIVYAHELSHKPGWTERNLGDLLMALVLYGHFRTEHLLVLHPWVGTSRDPVTARYNESFYRAFGRTMLTGFGSAWRAERALLARCGLGPWTSKSPCKLDHGLLAFDRGYRHFRLESRTVVPARSSLHGLLLARSVMLLLRGKSTYPGCSVIRRRLWPRWVQTINAAPLPP